MKRSKGVEVDKDDPIAGEIGLVTKGVEMEDVEVEDI